MSTLHGVLSFSYLPKEKFVKRVVGRTDVANALQRLDKLTHEETLMTVVKNLEMVHGIKDGAHRFLDHSYVSHTHHLFLY